MKSIKIAVAFSLVALVAVLDIAVVGLILNPAGITEQYVRIWHIAMFWVFVPGLFVILYVLHQNFIAVWFAGLVVSGWEDAFYFWMQGQTVPATLPWHPYLQTNATVYAGMVIGLVVLALATRRMA